MYIEDPDRGIFLTPEKATEILKNLGYDDIDKVPTGRGNDRLSAYVQIARGRFPGGVDLSTAIQIMRDEHNARENTPDRP